jgi:hypothetical protein
LRPGGASRGPNKKIQLQEGDANALDTGLFGTACQSGGRIDGNGRASGISMTVPRHCLVLLAGCLMAGAGSVPAATHLQYLYINASEDSASGGHAALKIGDEVFHFQHVPPGLLRLRRDDYAQFRDQYAGRENRTIRIHHVEVSEATQALLRERFNRILLVEDEQFERRDALENDRRLLAALVRLSRAGAAHSDPANRLVLRGAGLFLPDGWHYSENAQENSAQPVDASLARLAGRVAAAYGNGFLDAKSGEVLSRLKALQPLDYDAQAAVPAEGQFRSADYGFSGRYADGLSALAALRVLAAGLPLREGMLSRPKGAEFLLSDAEKRGLALYGSQLEDRLLGLPHSSRPDWGLALLLGMARLIALDESIASGHWVMLNLAEPRAAGDEPPAGPPGIRHAAFEVGRARFFAAKAALAGAETVGEWAYLQMEQAANVFAERGNALREGRMPSVDGVNPKPAHPASVELVLPEMSPGRLQAHLDSLDGYRSVYESSLAGLYSYDLIGRNCASEIFRVVGQAMREAGGGNPAPDGLAGAEGVAELESTRRLGGYASGLGLEFIPFLSFRIVGETWRIASTEVVPSYRLRELGQAKALQNPLWVGLRESNVFSSSLYQWHGGDPAFVFFTDDLLVARPLAGGFNVAAGLAQSLSGLLALPWDGGENLRMGVKGVLISLPELFFFNIRKGSFPGLP